MKINRLLLLAGVSIVLIFSCKHDPQYIVTNPPPVNCDTTNVSYTASVVAILNTNCTVCHGAANYAISGGGFKIVTYTDFAGFAKSGLMMNSLNGTGGLSTMPKGGTKLSSCDIAKIGIVVRKILDSLNTTVCDTTNITFPVSILPILQTYCLACHSTANAATLGAGYKFETLADFTTLAKTGLLMNSINQIAGLSAMPKGGSKLSACNITKIGIMVRLVGGTVTPPPPPVSSCSPDTVYFTNTLGPLILNSCGLTTSRCHNTGGNSPLLTTYANIRANVVPGSPSSSRIYSVLSGTGENAMPRSPVASFTAAQKLLVYNWIMQGAKNNSCVDAACDTTTVTYSGTIAPIFSTNCIGCHSSSGTSTTKLDSYTGAKAAVTAGRIIGAIQHSTGFTAMPPGGQLSACDIGKIKAWIFRGALNN